MKRLLVPLLLLAQPAMAATVGQAEFAPGTLLPAKVVVGDFIWTCADSRCAGPAETRPVAMQRTCNALARKVGAVQTFAVADTPLAAEALQSCNEKAGRAGR